MQLISLDNLKLDLGVTDNSRDAVLDRMNDRASAEVEQVVGYPIARAARTHAEHVSRPSGSLLIPFLPLHAVTKVTVDGAVWLDTANNVEPGRGFGFTPWGVIRAPYGFAFLGEVEIKFESGYRLVATGTPGEDRDLPLAFETAVAEIVRGRLHSLDRDPNVKSESVPGVYSVTFGSDNPSSVAVPAAVWDIIAPFRIVRVA